MCADRPDWPWSVLGAEGPLDSAAEVRRAYSRRLKEGDWSKDIEGFEALRRAYEHALMRTGGGRQRRNVVTDLPPPPATERPRIRQPAPDPAPETGPETGPEAGSEPPAPPPQAPLPDLTPEAQDGPVPDPAPRITRDKDDEENEDAAPDEAQIEAQAPNPWQFLARIKHHIREQDFSIAHWSKLLNALEMDDPRIRLSTERAILDHIAQPRPWPHSADWIRLIDRRFGWREDGVGLKRRHPDSETALLHIIDQLGRAGHATQKSRKPGRLRIPVRWVLKWLFRLAILVAGFRLLDDNAIIDSEQLAAFIAAAAFPVLFSAFRLMIALWLLRRIARLFARFSNWGWRKLEHFRSSWARPFFGMNRTRVLYALVMSVPLIALAPTYYGPSARLAMQATMIEALSEAMNKSLYQPPERIVTWFSDRDALPLPRFTLPRQGDPAATGPTDPYDIAMTLRLMHDIETDTPTSERLARGPRAHLLCRGAGPGETPSCELAMRGNLNAVRQVKWPEGKYSSYLTMPILQLLGVHDDFRHGGISASWANPTYAAIDTSAIGKALAPVKVQAFRLRTQMYMARLEYVAEPVTQQIAEQETAGPAMGPAMGLAALQELDQPARPIPLPVAALGRPMTLQFDWPSDLRDAVKCRGPVGMATNRVTLKCGATDLSSLQYGTWACPVNSPPESCNISPVHDIDAVPQIQASLVKTPALSVTFDDPDMLALQELMLRVVNAGPHLPLADTAATRRLRDAVLRDYALILDRPEAAAYRENKPAIRAALMRQPQLYWAYRASRDRRDAVWEHLQMQLRSLGFPAADTEMLAADHSAEAS